MNPPVNSTSSSSILCVGNGWFPTMPGGLNRYVYELTHQLVSQGDNVELCGVGLPPVEPNSPIKLTNLAEPNHSLLERLWLTHKNFKNRYLTQPNAINLHFSLYSLPLLSSFPKDVPVTFTFHGPWALESEREGAKKLGVWSKYWMEQQVYKHCDRFIVLSQAFGNILNQNYHIPWSKINMIPGGVDTHRFQANLSRQQAREQLNFPQDRFILFTPRRLVNRMGISPLLQALANLKSHIPDVWLAIAGKGILREKLEQQATELSLNHHVKFLGYLPDEQLPIAYQAADLTVVPSQALEGFGLILLESLASGTPVLCTPVGGMPEILEPFSPELITDSITVKAITSKLQAVLTGEISLPSPDASRNYASTHFNWLHIAQKVRQILIGVR
ncbi:glycosyltransferase family 4 protein [Limnoraphis robusta Tam1]|uniref:glycosyltransferase family 4 protein n=1 Tax=Limnoraphis robusta TaxID=1118279 RepID=UPI002B1F355D|nr:glycosyltransferase family 4 protein [Limnoraphis robusta]MEA5499849.1 glycosyltransferase family 4 protein [Limnoraphis robusta BA-68 BA1]MEA5538697.1 glycosyltransferase family 4 protein [Limnoraphis robusta Tam1]